MPSPEVLIIGQDFPARSALLAALADRQADAVDRSACSTALTDSPVRLIILMDRLDQAMLAQAIRSGGGFCATQPILACADTIHALVPAGCDDLLLFPDTPVAIARTVAAWLPRDGMAGARALAERFGAAQIMPMVKRLRGELETALASLDRGEDADHAHRIAGVAGTLGFADVSKSWLLLSEQGGKDAQRHARRAARIAIAEISRGTETDNAS